MRNEPVSVDGGAGCVIAEPPIQSVIMALSLANYMISKGKNRMPTVLVQFQVVDSWSMLNNFVSLSPMAATATCSATTDILRQAAGKPAAWI